MKEMLDKVFNKIKGKSSKVLIDRKYINGISAAYREATDMYFVYKARYSAAIKDADKYRRLYLAGLDKANNLKGGYSGNYKDVIVHKDKNSIHPDSMITEELKPSNKIINKVTNASLYGSTAINLDKEYVCDDTIVVDVNNLVDNMREITDKIRDINTKMANLDDLINENDEKLGGRNPIYNVGMDIVRSVADDNPELGMDLASAENNEKIIDILCNVVRNQSERICNLNKKVEALTKARNTAVKQLNDLREEYVEYKNSEPEEVKYKLIKWETTNSGLGDNIYKIVASTSTDTNMIDEYILMRRDNRGRKIFYRVNTNQGIYQRTKKDVAEEEGYFIIDELNMMVTFIPGSKDQK